MPVTLSFPLSETTVPLGYELSTAVLEISGGVVTLSGTFSAAPYVAEPYVVAGYVENDYVELAA